MKFVKNKEFAIVALDSENGIYIIHVVSFVIFDMSKIYLFCTAQRVSLQVKGTSRIIFPKYSDFVNIFSLELAIELPENMEIKTHGINLISSKQLLYEPIYCLKMIELKTLKTYIKIYLTTGFIKPLKWPAIALVLVI